MACSGQAVKEDSSESTSCIIVLCGLPGAGKTTLAQSLLTRSTDDELKIQVVSFDKMWHSEAKTGGKAQDPTVDFDPSVWKSARDKSLQQIAECIDQSEAQKPKRHKFAIIADDNMYYRSMRHRLFKFARTSMFHFHCVCCVCDEHNMCFVWASLTAITG